MKPQRLLVIGLILGALVLVGLLFAVPRLHRTTVLSGYVEGEALYLASPVSGTVKQMLVQRGDRISGGQSLFLVDPQQTNAAREQAAADLAAAQAQAQDARKGQRPSELAVFEANIAQAQAQARDAEAALRRIRPLVTKGIYAPSRLDDAQAAADAAQAQVRAAQRQRDTATLGQREDQIRAADSRVAQSQAGLAAAEARLADLSPKAPGPARVEDTFFQVGEWVSANQALVSLLPDDRIKLRFFVPEASVSAYRPGETVHYACDGCAAGLTAKITFVSPRPEFTPPVIYSREARDRLVYLVEARPGIRLNPGQPVDVTPLAAGGDKAR